MISAARSPAICPADALRTRIAMNGNAGRVSSDPNVETLTADHSLTKCRCLKRLSSLNNDGP
jgi:hypothetical protein